MADVDGPCDGRLRRHTKFPREEVLGLTSQLRRASVSVASNIAEGQGRTTIGEIIQFVGMPRGSVQEVQTQLELSSRLNFGVSSELDKAVQARK